MRLFGSMALLASFIAFFLQDFLLAALLLIGGIVLIVAGSYAKYVSGHSVRIPTKR